eukprot:2233186-Amphidinium_carterae.1
MLPPPTPQHPLSGGRSALHPTGRVPVTPPAIAGLGVIPAAQPLVVGDAESDDFMDIGEPDNPN